MRAVISRLQSGQRWWAAELAFRVVATAFFVLAATCARAVEQLAQRSPGQPAGMAAFGLAALAFALLVAGLTFAIEGPGLFRLVPYPRRRLF